MVLADWFIMNVPNLLITANPPMRNASERSSSGFVTLK